MGPGLEHVRQVGSRHPRYGRFEGKILPQHPHKFKGQPCVGFSMISGDDSFTPPSGLCKQDQHKAVASLSGMSEGNLSPQPVQSNSCHFPLCGYPCCEALSSQDTASGSFTCGYVRMKWKAR